MSRWTAALFPHDLVRLADASDRLAVPGEAAAQLLRQALPLAVAFSGHAPSQLTAGDLDALETAVDATQRLTPTMRRKWRSLVFALRRVLFESSVVDAPAVHRRGDGRAAREARLAAVAAPEIRRTLLAYIDAAPGRAIRNSKLAGLDATLHGYDVI